MDFMAMGITDYYIYLWYVIIEENLVILHVTVEPLTTYNPITKTLYHEIWAL